MAKRMMSAVTLLTSTLVGAPGMAAEVTSDRLISADKEPQNWLMNHRTYDAQRYSPLDRINTGNASRLKLAYAVALGGTSTNANLESTPLAEDGYLYVVDHWGVLYKIDGRSGDLGRIVWRMDPGQEKLPLANRGAALWGNFVVTVANWGTGNPVPMYDPFYRPGDNLYTNSLISWDPDTGKMNWYHQYVPGDMWDYDAAGTHILIDGQIGGQPHKLVTHSQRNGFLYSFERANGQTLLATPYQETISWTKGIDQKTGLPLDYDPNRDIQVYSGLQNQTPTDRTKKLCPSHDGGSNFWSASYSQKTKLLYIPTRSTCDEISLTQDIRKNANGIINGASRKYIARNETDLVVADPFTGEIKKKLHVPYPDNSAALTTGGGLLITGFTDGTVAAYDDVSLDQLWHFNVGSGINAPPMTFEINGKQYVVIQSGLNRNALAINAMTPELRDMRNQTMLFVFGL
jgi:glucose dehydrogenase